MYREIKDRFESAIVVKTDSKKCINYIESMVIKGLWDNFPYLIFFDTEKDFIEHIFRVAALLTSSEYGSNLSYNEKTKTYTIETGNLEYKKRYIKSYCFDTENFRK